MSPELNSGKKSKQKASKLKKLILYPIAGLFLFFLVAAITVPLFFDVDKYRPQILTEANKNIDGKLELGKLKLSLWGKVQIDIDGLKLFDSHGKNILQVKDAGFHLPLVSFLTGRPELRLIMNEPVIHAVKGQDGKINFLKLIKTSSSSDQAADSSASSSATSTASEKSKTSSAVGVPTWLMTARFTFNISKANLTYQDLKTGEDYKIRDLDFLLEDVSPSSKMPFKVAANLDLEMQNKTKISGPFSLKGVAKPEGTLTEIRGASLNADLDLDKLEIISGENFQKKSGVPLNLQIEAKALDKNIDMPKLHLQIGDIRLDAKASAQTTETATLIKLRADTNDIELSKLGNLSPMAKSYDLNGMMDLKLDVSGPTDKLNYGGEFKFTNVQLKSENMHQALRLDGSVKLGANEIEKLLFKLKADEFDLTFSGRLQDFSKPKFQMTLSSSEMNLDKLLKSSSQAADARKKAAQSAPPEAGESTTKSAVKNKANDVVDYNAMFEPLRSNKLVADSAGSLEVSIKKLKTTGVIVDDLKSTFVLSNLVFSMKELSMRVFGGTIKGAMNIDMKSKRPTVTTSVQLAGLQTLKMSESQMPMLKDTLKGTMSGAMNLNGDGLNHSDVVANWKGGGNLAIKDAVFSTFEIGKQIRDGVVSKLPAMVKSKINIPDSLINQKGEYESVTMKYSLNNGIFEFTELNGKAHPNKGLDLKGSGRVMLANYGLEANLDFIDTYNMTKGESYAKDKRYGHFTLSPRITGSVFDPKFDWGSTIGRLAQSAMEQKGKEVLQKTIQDKLPGGLGNIFNKGGGGGGDSKPQAPSPGEAVKALKGLFGR